MTSTTTKDPARELRRLVKTVTDTENTDVVTSLKNIVQAFIEEEVPEALNETDPFAEINSILKTKHLPVPSSVTKKAVSANKKFLKQLKEMYAL